MTKPGIRLGQGEPSMLKILFVGTQMALGGAQRLLLDQAAWFHDHGHAVWAAFFYDKQGLSERWSRDAAFPLRPLSSMGAGGGLLRRSIGLLAALWRLWALMRTQKFDVIQTFTYDSNLLALPLARLAGIPVRIATHHGIIEGFPRSVERLHTWLINWGVASILVSVSRKVLEQAAAVGIRREHMTVIPNGIPLRGDPVITESKIRAEFDIGERDVVVLSVGRLVYQKGHEYLIQALPGLLRSAPNVRVIICGEGPLRSQLESQIMRLGVERAVRLAGNRMDIRDFLETADIFALPSRWEGLPVALLEAMERGLPIVATRVEGVEEVIAEPAQGMLVPPEDAAALHTSLLALASDAKLRREMGERGRARVHQAYTVDTMCERYASLMWNLLDKTRGMGRRQQVS